VPADVSATWAAPEPDPVSAAAGPATSSGGYRQEESSTVPDPSGPADAEGLEAELDHVVAAPLEPAADPAPEASDAGPVEDAGTETSEPAETPNDSIGTNRPTEGPSEEA
jgi:hypothetical protein